MSNAFIRLIEQEKEKAYFQSLFRHLDLIQKRETIYPPLKDVFKALSLTPFEEVKIVILGQDPYHKKNQANGLCFSVNKGVKLPPSLENIYKEITLEYGFEMPNHGDLTEWAKRGVLLLNTILTVSESKPLSHQGLGWEKFTDEVIKLLQEKQFLIYILLGNHAQSYEKKITNKNHVILKTSHPSPLSSYRGFLGSNIFKKANQALKERGIPTVDFQIR